MLYSISNPSEYSDFQQFSKRICFFYLKINICKKKTKKKNAKKSFFRSKTSIGELDLEGRAQGKKKNPEVKI